MPAVDVLGKPVCNKMKKLFLVSLFLLACPLLRAQTHTFPAEDTDNVFTRTNAFQGSTDINLHSYTIAGLPSPASVPVGYIVSITDALTTGSCSAGSGLNISLCRNSGIEWIPLGSSSAPPYPPAGIAVSTGSAWSTAATSTTILGLWGGSCSSSTYMRGDGFCQTPAGAGDVLSSGSPINGQIAQWTNSTTIQGVTLLPTSAFPALTGDVTNSAGALATTVGKINGTSLAGLATGILKNTTATGVPSIAASADVIGLWTGACNSGTFLRADGTCQSAGAGNVSISGSPTQHQTTVWASGTSILGVGPGTTGFPLVSAGASADPSYAQLSLTAGVTGTLPIANGGTGTASTLTGLVRGSGSAMTAAELSGDATTSASNAVTVKKINGVALSGLATGILKNTTTTGVPSIAASADVIGLWSGSCSSSTYLGGGGACGTGTQYSIPYWSASTTLSGTTPPATNGQYGCGYTVSSSASVAPTCPQVGFAPRGVTGTTDTVLYSDNSSAIVYTGSSAVAVALPTPTTLVNSNFVTTITNYTTQNVTVTPTTFTVSLNGGVAGATAIVPSTQRCSVFIDPLTVSQWDVQCSVPTASGGLSGMTTGQVAIAGTSTTITSSKALAGSGAGITTGPASGVVSGDIASFTGTGGQVADSGVVAANVLVGPTPTLGTDNSIAGTLQLANSAANAHTIFSSGATTSNTIKGFSTAPTTGDLVSCTTASTTCTLTDSGLLAASVVKASSPGAGIARFAGSTQTVTSAELSGDATTSGSNAVTVVQVNGATIPASKMVLASNGSNQFIAATVATSFTNSVANSNTGVLTAVAQNATKLMSFYIPYWIGTLNNIGYAVTTADNTANVYDLGIYGPGCNAAGTSIPLVAHTGPIAGTTLFPSTGTKNAALTGAPVTTTITPGWYCFAYTSSAAVPAAVMGGDAINAHLTVFANAAAPGGGTGTTSSGTLNGTITAPATSNTIGSVGLIVLF